jgi:hypothetical protein
VEKEKVFEDQIAQMHVKLPFNIKQFLLGFFGERVFKILSYNPNSVTSHSINKKTEYVRKNVYGFRRELGYKPRKGVKKCK